MALYIVDDAVELVKRLRCLRIKVNVACEVELGNVFKLFYDNGAALRLPHQPKHLGMAFLAEDYYLRKPVILMRTAAIDILCFDTALQLKHHRTRGVYYLNAVTPGQLVCLGRFAMGTQQHFHTMQTAHVVVVYRYKPHFAQALTLHSVVNYITETIQCLPLCQFFLGLLYGSSHTKAKPAAVVYLYL